MRTQNLTDSKAYTLKLDHTELILGDNNISLLLARALKEMLECRDIPWKTIIIIY